MQDKSRILNLFNKIESISNDVTMRHKFACGNTYDDWQRRGIQGEMFMGYIARLIGCNFKLASVKQTGFDCSVDGLKIQVKQRTLRSHGFYSVDNIHHHNFENGNVDAFVVFETNEEQQLQRIILVSADKIFKHPKLYYSKYNSRWQLSKSRFYAVADSIINLVDAKQSTSKSLFYAYGESISNKTLFREQLMSDILLLDKNIRRGEDMDMNINAANNNNDIDVMHWRLYFGKENGVSRLRELLKSSNFVHFGSFDFKKHDTDVNADFNSLKSFQSQLETTKQKIEESSSVIVQLGFSK